MKASKNEGMCCNQFAQTIYRNSREVVKSTGNESSKFVAKFVAGVRLRGDVFEHEGAPVECTIDLLAHGKGFVTSDVVLVFCGDERLENQ